MRSHAASAYLTLATALILPAPGVNAQQVRSDADIPVPDPGYRIYYHGDLGQLEVPLRWGYHEGWQQGRADRDRTLEARPTQTDNYRTAPEHGAAPSLNRTQYQRFYREAFLRGYEHGYKF